MARGGRNGRNTSNRRGAHISATSARPQRQSSNIYVRLGGGHAQDGEVNADLTERFGRTSMSFRGHSDVPHDSIPISAPLRINNDIRKYFELAKKPVTAGPWIDKPEIPTSSEILPRAQQTFESDQALIDVGENIRPHRPEGAYDNNDDYLGTKYELLREDALRPLREAVAEVRKDPWKDEAEYDNHSIGIYDPVYITSLVFSPRGLATRVAFSLSRVKKYIRWDQSKRLITGSLVALSPADDAFKSTCILATVAARPVFALEQNPPEIDLFFGRPEEQEIDPMKKWIMVECRASFFEASRHTMLALQHLMREPFPLSEHLVKAERDVGPPAYIHHNPYVNLSSLVSMEDSAAFENINVLEEFPAPTKMSLDKSQGKALQQMLTKKLAIVQGPPGTGKTHVSVVMIKVQRDNLRKEDSPIIITAQTNHAVDQILRHTKEFEPNFIRLGGRSKDADIKKRTLFEVRQEVPQQRQPGSQRVQATNALRKLTNQFVLLLAPLEANKPPIDHRVLLSLGLITKEQAESLVLDSDETMGISSSDIPGILMEKWLGKCLAPCHRPSQPDDYGWGFEEEDLEVEQLQELEAEAVARDDDDIENLHGQVFLVSDNHMGKGGSLLTSSGIRELLRTTSDLTEIPIRDRGAIYNYFKREVKALIAMEVRKLSKEYAAAVLQRKVGMWEEDVQLLSQQRIIGCTTTGLSKYRPLISALRPRIVLVEEAAETMEAPVTSACFPTLEHLILVGDHQQLRPHTQVHAFEDEPYFLNLSLFERMVRNNVAYSTLTRQRRMLPEIRRLLAPIYGDTLKDHQSVLDLTNRPPVEGMGGINSYFFCHEWPEARDGNMSCYNEHEAAMITGFVDYLVLNGVDASKITLLTFYNGQRKCLLRQLRNHQNFRAFSSLVKVVTVDGYQGEENDIVILSLVRSNRRGDIGFLDSENRACVALSRAKRGFYIFGNAELLARETRVWAKVVEIMYGSKHGSKPKLRDTTGSPRRVGYFLPLQCKPHEHMIFMQEPDDWAHIHGGCDEKCVGTLPCGHKCPYRCHPFEHYQVNCMMQCGRPLNCGHACVALCGETCKCQLCERRNQGSRSMLKAVPHSAGGVRQVPDTSRGLMANTTYQTPANHAPAFRTRDLPNAAEKWQAYTKGGAAADDARVYQAMKEEEAKYLETVRNTPPIPEASSASGKLIKFSPEKKAANSKNMGLLIDLDFGESAQVPRPPPGFGSTNAVPSKSSGKGKAPTMNLMD